MNHTGAARKTVYFARLLILLAIVALIGAWISQLRNGSLLGMSQQHLFNDAMALGILGVAFLTDAWWHERGI